MTNVVPLERTCEYLVQRAARHRRAGRYDEAMTLLSRAKEQFGCREEIELGFARTYDEMECEEEAARAYLRVVRFGGKECAGALFSLALSSAQRADLTRAQSYFERFAATDHGDVSEEYAALLHGQIKKALERPAPVGRRGRARQLERRAVECLQAGKTAAAARTIRHALALHPTAQGYTLLACCHLLMQNGMLAVENAKIAHALAPSRVQTLCVLADAYALAGDGRASRKALYLAALRAHKTEDLLGAALESAKHGEDELTLRMTKSVLGREPFHTRAMMIRGCAMANLGRMQEAARLFGRLCVLTPEDTVAAYYYRMAREETRPPERLTLGLDVPRQEAASRVMQLIAALYASPQEIGKDPVVQRELCRLGAWAFRSPMAGEHAALVSLMLMAAFDTELSREVLLDALTDPQIPDGFKCAILQVMTGSGPMKPYDADIGGRLVKLAAGGVTSCRGGEGGQKIVQQAADMLTPRYPDAPGKILPMWLNYLDMYGLPKGERQEAASAAALEYLYHETCGRRIALLKIARRYSISKRLAGRQIRRIRRALTIKKNDSDSAKTTRTEENREDETT